MKLLRGTIFRKLFLQMGIIILGIILMTVTIIAVYYGNREVERTKQVLRELSANTDRQIQGLITDMEKLALYVSTSADVSTSFVSAKKDEVTDFHLYQKNSKIINSIMVPNSNSKYRISLYNGGVGNFISFGRPVEKTKVAAELKSGEYENVYHEIMEDNTQILLMPDPWSFSNQIHIRIFRNIYDPNLFGKVVGIVEVSIPVQSLDVYTSNQSCLIIDGSQIYGNLNILQSDYIRERVTTEQGWEIVSGEKRSNVFSVTGFAVILIFSVGIVFLMVSYLILYKVLKKIVQPLNDLTDRVNEVTIHNLHPMDAQFPEGSINEVENLKFAFDKLLQNLQVSIQDAMDAKTCEMQANYIALQAQMDPHFLYNMLAVIRIFSKESDFGSTAKMCDYLCDMLRYISNYKNDVVYAEQEVNHAVNYMKLMKYRYEDNFDYQISVSLDFLEKKLQIPRLCLQPIVENTFCHAFKKSLPPWKITIEGYLEEDHWVIAVKDNGCGMSKEEVGNLMQNIDVFSKNISSNIGELKLGGMGLVNMVARLRIKYKNDMVFRIETEEMKGTTFIIGGILK